MEKLAISMDLSKLSPEERIYLEKRAVKQQEIAEQYLLHNRNEVAEYRRCANFVAICGEDVIDSEYNRKDLKRRVTKSLSEEHIGIIIVNLSTLEHECLDVPGLIEARSCPRH